MLMRIMLFFGFYIFVKKKQCCSETLLAAEFIVVYKYETLNKISDRVQVIKFLDW